MNRTSANSLVMYKFKLKETQYPRSIEMMPAQVPPQETERLAALYRYRILDTAPEEAFDRITSLANQVFGIPIAVINFVDASRQWGKSCHGLDDTEAIREISFCAHTILQGSVMVVENAHADERFHDNPMVTQEPYIYFYAAAPLLTSDGYALGTLCLVDQEPYEWSEKKSQILKNLAQVVISELELRNKRWEIEAQLATVERINRQKSEFITDISHELRTPLTSILGFSQLMLAGLGEAIGPRNREYLFILYDSGEQMLALINNLLALEKIETGHLDLEKEEVDIKSLIQRSIQVLKLKAEHKEITLVSEFLTSLSPFWGDHAKLNQIFLNLISHSLRFTPVGGQVTLRVFESDRYLNIELTDTRVEMHEDTLQQLFQRFSEVDSSKSRRHMGTGLGLVLAKRFVEMHGGQIEISGRESIFRLQFPLDKGYSITEASVME